jgi:two-component system OmpR family sensor kinase
MLIAELKDSANLHRASQIESSLTRLSHLSEKVLQLSRAEAGIGVTDKPADLAQVLEMVITDFQRGMADPQRLVLVRAPDAQLVGRYNPDAFAIVMRNLIENALIHGDPEGPVRVDLESGGAVRIVNEAPVLGAHELASIRKRFSRGNTTANGSGLGLSIVERLLGQMNGRLVLLSPASGQSSGFEARVELPTA